MKTLGLIGGVSWVSTADYYGYINEGINEKLGGLNFARLILHSLNYGEVKKNNESGNMIANYEMVADACRHMKAGGAEGLVLCANTMHMMAEKLEAEIQLPVIHIAIATAHAIKKKKRGKAGLLGTKFTMEMDFFKDRLAAQQIETIIPGEDDRAFIHHTIFEELGRGIIREETQTRYRAIMQQLAADGADSIILGCTEIPLLISQEDSPVPVFDTTRIHAAAAVDFAIA